MTRWVALLRGINLGKRQVKKEALIAAATACGYAAPRTLLASGNLLFETGDGAAAIARDLRAAVHQESGVDADVFVRNAGQMAATVAANPFPDAAQHRPSHLVVFFHDTAVTPAMIAAITDGYDGPERLIATGHDLYIDYPDGQGRSMLEPAMRKARPKLPVGTARNWNTVRKIAELLNG